MRQGSVARQGCRSWPAGACITRCTIRCLSRLAAAMSLSTFAFETSQHINAFVSALRCFETISRRARGDLHSPNVASDCSIGNMETNKGGSKPISALSASLGKSSARSIAGSSSVAPSVPPDELLDEVAQTPPRSFLDGSPSLSQSEQHWRYGSMGSAMMGTSLGTSFRAGHSLMMNAVDRRRPPTYPSPSTGGL